MLHCQVGPNVLHCQIGHNMLHCQVGDLYHSRPNVAVAAAKEEPELVVADLGGRTKEDHVPSLTSVPM